MNEPLIAMGKEKIINFLRNDVANGEPRERIRVVEINWDDEEQAECITQLIGEGYISPTDDEKICLISQGFYQTCKGGKQQ